LIDFRYHLVSIVSIFLALAVGIVLGAGPLKGELGATLEEEVAGLRTDKAQLNEQLDLAQRGVDARDQYISATAPITLADTLSNRSVALVVYPGTDSGLVDTTAATMATAGAQVVSRTSVADDWVSADEGTVDDRETVVEQVASASGLAVEGDDARAKRDVLLAALLTLPSGTDAVPVGAARAWSGLEALADAGLISLDLPEESFEQAELVVALSAAVTSGDEEARGAAAAQWVDLTAAFADRTTATVLVAQVRIDVDGVWVVTALRDDADAAGTISSVDDAADPMGQASIVNALVAQAAGTVGQYGLEGGADAPSAPVPSPTPTAP
jgi:hypothetical protein